MTKVKSLIIATCLIFTIIFLFSGCSYKDKLEDIMGDTLTQEEVVAETKSYLSTKFSSEYVYEKLSLPNKYTVNDKYDSYITWISSNNSIINSTSGNVYRTLNNQNCNLTANITYKDCSESITFYLIIPANKYERTIPSFNPDSSSQFQFQVAYMAYNTNGTVTIDLYFYNNYAKEKTVYAITSAYISIYKNSSTVIGGNDYFLKEYHYTNSKSKQFTCTYHNYVKISLGTLSANQVTKYTLKNNTNIKVALSGNFTFNSAV